MRDKNMTTKPRPGRSGFTLIEIMLALGVLGVGMVMVATVFPAAIHQTRQSDRNTKAVLIAGNARTVLSMKLTHARLSAADPAVWNPSSNEFREIVMYNDECDDDLMSPDNIILYDTDAWFPMPVRQEWEAKYGLGEWPPNRKDHRSSYDENAVGWLVLARRLPASSREYQFVVIPYAESDAIDYRPDTTIREDEWLDTRPRLALFATNGNPMNSSIAAPYSNVIIKQYANGRCEVWFHLIDHEMHFPEINLGSPVILAASISLDADVMGRHPVIVGLTEKLIPDPDNGNAASHRATLSGPLFDTKIVGADVILANDDTNTQIVSNGISRAIYLVTTGYKESYSGTRPMYRAKSPALRCTSFRMKLKP